MGSLLVQVAIYGLAAALAAPIGIVVSALILGKSTRPLPSRGRSSPARRSSTSFSLRPSSPRARSTRAATRAHRRRRARLLFVVMGGSRSSRRRARRRTRRGAPAPTASPPPSSPALRRRDRCAGHQLRRDRGLRRRAQGDRRGGHHDRPGGLRDAVRPRDHAQRLLRAALIYMFAPRGQCRCSPG